MAKKTLVAVFSNNYPDGIYLFKISNGSTRTMSKI